MNRTLVAGLLLAGLASVLASPAFANRGSYKKLGERPWPNVGPMAALDGRLYFTAGITLYAVDKHGKGGDIYHGKDHEFGKADAMTVVDKKIYLCSGGVLYEVERNQNYRAVNEDWRKVSGMTAVGDKLYIVDNDALYLVDKKTGKGKSLGAEDWYSVRGMTALDGQLYVMNGETLYEVDAQGNKRQLDGRWGNVLGFTSANGKLYIYTYTTEGGAVLHEVDKTGKDTVLLPRGLDGKGIHGMIALDDKIYAIATGSDAVFYIVDLK